MCENQAGKESANARLGFAPACQGNTCDVLAVFSRRSLMPSTSCLKSPVRLLKLSVPSEQPVSPQPIDPPAAEQGDEGPSVVCPPPHPRRGSFLAVLLFVQTCDTFHSPQALVATSLMNVSLAPQGLCCISLRLNASGRAPPPRFPGGERACVGGTSNGAREAEGEPGWSGMAVKVQAGQHQGCSPVVINVH